MAEGRETSVFYNAVADFASLNKSLRQARREIAKTRAAEKAYNAESQKNFKTAQKLAASQGSTNTSKKEAAAVDKATEAISKKTRALKENAVATDRAAKSTVKFVDDVGKVNKATGEVVEELKKSERGVSRWSQIVSKAISLTQSMNAAAVRQSQAVAAARMREQDATGRVRLAEVQLVEARKKYLAGTSQVIRAEERLAASKNRLKMAQDRSTAAMVRFRNEGGKLPPIFAQLESGGNRFYRGMQRFANWRPRLTPPFVALIPIIGAVIASLNPLLALLGSVGAAAFGLASTIGSLSGAFLALPGILSGVVAGISSVIASMGGVGNVFKTYSAMQKATNSSGGGSTGPTQAERADDLADAEWNLAKAQRTVQKAQENLNKARERALRNLIDLRLEASRASLNEERAIANLRKAQEEYWNVMADPGSTLGDKLDAAASIKEAEADLDDVRKKNIDNQKELNEAEKKGINNSEEVLDAQENLTDALKSQRDAQKSLNKEQAGGATSTAAVNAVNEYNEALAKLSPSARKFVLAIIAMKGQWEDFQRDMQETFFSQFADDLDRLPRLLKTLGNFLRPAAKAMGQFVDKFMELLDSPEWASDLTTIGEQNGSVITNLGDGFLALATALKDVIIAAGPFTEWMTNGFARGAENFRDFIADARETGSLAEWLDKVKGRMEKWWTVIKNIGATLFNYSAAAEGFGNWVLEGLVEITDAWREASEAARDEDSPFRQYLEDIKPLLSEVKGLFGDFFGWLRDEMMDPENIQDAQDLVKLLRDDLGPAIGRLLDTLAETDIDESFIKALSAILDSLDTILENGGGEAFEAFFDVVVGGFEWLADVVSQMDPDMLEAILKFVGFMAGVSFVGKFTGLTAILGGLLSLGGNTLVIGGLKKIFGYFKNLDGLKFAKLLGKGGLIALILGLGVAGLSNFANTTDTRDNANAVINGKPGEGDVDQLIEDMKSGEIAKAVGVPGIVSEILKGFDGLFGTQFSAEFDSWLGDISTGLFDWFTGISRWWTSTVAPGWEGFWNGFADGWEGTWNRVFGGWKKFTTELQGNFTTFSVVFKTGWDGFLGGLGTVLGIAIDGMGQAWAGIQERFRGPANWVIQNVWNNGIRAFWNSTATKLGLAPLPEAGMIGGAPTAQHSQGNGLGGAQRRSGYAKGGVLPGYTPGRDVHRFVSNTGGTLDLSGGEAIMRPEFTRLVGGKKGVDDINKRAIRGEAFATGGVFGRQNGGAFRRNIGGKIQKKADIGGDLLGGIFSDPMKFVGDGLKGIVNPLLSQMSGDGWSGVMKAIPGKLIDGLMGQVKSWFTTNPAGGGGAANAMGWQRQWAIVKQAFPWANLSSGYRSPGGNAAVGGVKGSYHTQGRAIDVNPSMEIFNWLRENFPNSRELIYSPANGRQLQNGRNHMWGQPVRNQHFSHVHWAMRNGGVLPGLYDNGGWLPDGGMAVNKSGKPEAVLDPQESRALKALLSGSGLTAKRAMGATAAVAASQAAPQIIDNSINIEKVELINPVPESMSQSLPKTIRNIGYMNQARTGQKQ